MTKKTVGYVELEWTCPNCGNRNPGAEQKCATCGTAQPEEIEFEQPVQEELISDEAEVQAAQAGPDIHCPYCGTRNPADAQACKQCAGDLTGGTARGFGRVVGAHKPEEAPPVACPACGVENPATNLKCTACGAALTKPEPAQPAEPQAPRGSGRLLLILAILAIACIAVFVILSLRTKALTGQVAGTTWTRRIVVEALMPLTRQDWRDQVPADASLGQCRERVHHTQSEPEPGAIEVCGTPYTVDLGSGYGEVVQDCEYQVYEEWCDYTVMAWQQFDSVVAQGADFSPYWPAAVLQQDQREGDRQEEYQVILDADGEDYRYTPRSFAEFTQFTPGSRWRLEVNSFGSLVNVEPAP